MSIDWCCLMSSLMLFVRNMFRCQFCTTDLCLPLMSRNNVKSTTAYSIFCRSCNSFMHTHTLNCFVFTEFADCPPNIAPKKPFVDCWSNMARHSQVLNQQYQCSESKVNSFLKSILITPLFNVTLDQGCTTYGPLATCGSLKLCLWPAWHATVLLKIVLFDVSGALFKNLWQLLMVLFQFIPKSGIFSGFNY